MQLRFPPPSGSERFNYRQMAIPSASAFAGLPLWFFLIKTEPFYQKQRGENSRPTLLNVLQSLFFKP